MEHGLEIQQGGLAGGHGGIDFEQIRAADGFVQRTKAERGENAAGFLCDETQVGDDVFRLALEAFADFGILRRNAGGACVVLALTKHHAA